MIALYERSPYVQLVNYGGPFAVATFPIGSQRIMNLFPAQCPQRGGCPLGFSFKRTQKGVPSKPAELPKWTKAQGSLFHWQPRYTTPAIRQLLRSQKLGCSKRNAGDFICLRIWFCFFFRAGFCLTCWVFFPLLVLHGIDHDWICLFSFQGA